MSRSTDEPSAPAGTERAPDASRLRGLAPLVGGFLLLLAVVVGSGALVVMQRVTVAEMRRSYDLRSAIATLFSTLQDAETGQRGYLLTGEDSYLAPYAEATAQFEAGLAGVEAAMATEPDLAGLVASLRSAATEKIAELGRTIALRQAGQEAASRDLMRSGRGKDLMDRVRTLVNQLETESARVLEARQDRAADTERLLQIVIAVAVLLALALAAYAILDARQRSARLVSANAALLANHYALAATVASRDALEAQLRQSQKMEAIGQLTGGLAHDFNNMLAIILGNLNLLKRRLDRGETRVGHYIEQALTGAERAATLTHRLLAFARKQPLAPETLDCNRLVSGMSELLRRTLGETVQMETVLAGGLWATRADANQLENGLVNLAVNARDAMPGGGRLTIETSNAHLDDAYAASHLGVPAGQYVMIAITDTGVGMMPDVVARAFDPFFTTKQVGQGTGLGLSQVYGFVKQSDGHVKIYSEPNHGTTVKIYLPRLVGPVPAPAGRQVHADIPEGHPGEIILVVEDEDNVRRMAVEALRDLRYTVIHASGPAEALRLLDRQGEIALLFTDVVMPDMSGKELADAVRRLRPGLPVLYTTGYTRNAIVHNGIVDSDVQLLGKPYTLEQLARKVRTVLAESAKARV
ncbi:CHASE3 domain-containing protein [Methylobacterium soli]|uniref:histidine kinase n=1 Tax=Methylobacterium soli TaxID=553447 RepID=A0A6L3T8X0_9HYPH|nr:CHASE3 domain-containing protein [Methylobacterium soli]KAB1081732.1 response regulator [Methylobacterium soli]GJE41831.1 Sensor histidine kinase RcsC [Methylobacterium soli]